MGTPLYLSPEMLLGHMYDHKIDVWALGALAYELYTLSTPFQVRNRDELKRIVTDDFTMEEGSVELSNFLSHCLKKDPQQRPSAGRLLRHPFIVKWGQLETAEEMCE